MIKILHITPDFNYSCGRSKLVYLYLEYLSNKKNYEVHFITNGGDSLDRLKEVPAVNFQIFRFTTGYQNIIYKKNFIKLLKEYVSRNNISLIHTHHRFPEASIVQIANELNVKTITTAHSFVKNFKGWGFNSDIVLTVSDAVKKYIIEKCKVSSERILTLHNPIENSQLINKVAIHSIKAEKKLTEKNKIILFIGRLCRDKGFDKLQKALKLVKAKNKNAILIAVGQIEENKKVYNRFLNGEGVIYFPPQKRVESFYEMSDIVVLPSRVDPFPFVMLEAGIHKKPFIGGNTGGIAEFIEDGKNGLLIDPENPEQLAEKILCLLNNPDVGEKLGENLHQKVKQLCDYNSYFSQVEKIYNELIGA